MKSFERRLGKLEARSPPFCPVFLTVMFMEGDDHVEAYTRLPEAVAALHQVAPNLDARIASLEEYATATPSPSTSLAGEIIDGRYRPILRAVNSTRAWIRASGMRLNGSSIMLMTAIVSSRRGCSTPSAPDNKTASRYGLNNSHDTRPMQPAATTSRNVPMTTRRRSASFAACL